MLYYVNTTTTPLTTSSIALVQVLDASTQAPYLLIQSLHLALTPLYSLLPVPENPVPFPQTNIHTPAQSTPARRKGCTLHCTQGISCEPRRELSGYTQKGTSPERDREGKHPSRRAKRHVDAQTHKRTDAHSHRRTEIQVHPTPPHLATPPCTSWCNSIQRGTTWQRHSTCTASYRRLHGPACRRLRGPACTRLRGPGPWQRWLRWLRWLRRIAASRGATPLTAEERKAAALCRQRRAVLFRSVCVASPPRVRRVSAALPQHLRGFPRSARGSVKPPRTPLAQTPPQDTAERGGWQIWLVDAEGAPIICLVPVYIGTA